MNLPQFPLAITAIPTQAKPDILGSAVTLSALKLAAPEGTESILVPLVNQFGVMQQQMFDQFQQAMAMMLQMFGTMHREQMEVIQGELDQLHGLTEEVRALETNWRIRTLEEGETAANPSDIASEAAETEGNDTDRSGDNGNFRGDENPRPRRDDGSLANQPSSWPSMSPEPKPSFASPAEHSPPRTSQASAPTPPTEGLQEPVAPPRGRADGPTAPADPERDSIAWLHQRIMTLQRERETRWQKILKLLPGIS